MGEWELKRTCWRGRRALCVFDGNEDEDEDEDEGKGDDEDEYDNMLMDVADGALLARKEAHDLLLLMRDMGEVVQEST
jgi:hypothetical protein